MKASFRDCELLLISMERVHLTHLHACEACSAVGRAVTMQQGMYSTMGHAVL